MKTYRVFDHTADLGIEISGRTQAELFSRAARALFDLLLEAVDARKTASTENRTLVIDGADSVDLFVNFLREILYLFNGEGLVLTGCRIVQIDTGHLTAHIRCRRYDARTDRVKSEIKAVTYHQAAVMQTATGWRARVVFDV